MVQNLNVHISKAFRKTLLRRIVRMENTGKGTAIYKKKPSHDWLKKCGRTESNNMSPNLSVLALLPCNAYFLPVGANLQPSLIPSLLLLIQPLNFIFYKILPVLNITMTVDFLFLPKTAHLSIYLLLKPLLSKLLTLPFADKKNSFTA